MTNLPTWLLICGEVTTCLRDLPDESVHSVVTSPPYWGLRDYKVAGQLGLEDTPDEWCTNLVNVFREVRRVLRADGTCWVNLGDSYVSKTGGGGGGFLGDINEAMREEYHFRRKVPPGLKPKDLVGQPWLFAEAMKRPYYTGIIKDERDRHWLAALVDGEGCFTILETTSPHCSGTSLPPILQVRMCDEAPVARCAAIAGMSNVSPRQYPPSQGGNHPSYNWRVSARKAATLARELYPYLLAKKRQALVVWNQQLIRDSYETKRGVQIPAEAREKMNFLRALIRDLNKRRPVIIPDWLEEPPPLTEPGWYLRCDCIWNKPNPTPEPARSRPMRAHEYIFLFTKSSDYWYDDDAVRVPHTDVDRGKMLDPEGRRKSARGGDLDRTALDPGRPKMESGGLASGKSRTLRAMDQGRKRTYNELGKPRPSVWTVASQPSTDEHFAAYPEKLIDPCILAGCPPGGTVLDPFTGSGTTGVVALKRQRSFIGIELNPKYCEMARRRLSLAAPLFSREERSA